MKSPFIKLPVPRDQFVWVRPRTISAIMSRQDTNNCTIWVMGGGGEDGDCAFQVNQSPEKTLDDIAKFEAETVEATE